MAAKVHSAILDFNKKSMFNGIQLLDTKENPFSSKFTTFKDKIKIKRHAKRLTPPSIKCQKSIQLMHQPKQIKAGQIV